MIDLRKRPKLDTSTVLTIIEMIDVRIKWLDSEDDKPEGFSFAGPEEPYFGKQYLTELKDHLQEFIEQEVNAVENKTGE